VTCIELTNVWKSYKLGNKRIVVLKGVSLEVREGELVAVVGPSGAGKSTLLNVVSTIDYPDKGSVYHMGTRIRKSEEWRAKWRRKNVGIVFQNVQLIPTLTALENILLPMELNGVPRDRALRRARSLLQLMDLADKADRYPAELSGGEQQRVAVARALANDPKVVVADEPVSNLDPQNRSKVASVLRSLADSGKCVVVSTHEEELKSVSDRVCQMERGVLRC